MRGIRACLVLAAACCLWAQAPQKCAIEGRALSASTGAPLKKTTVWLEVFSATRGVNGSPTVAGPSTLTDAQGRFRLEDLEPGTYFLSARRGGYLEQGYGAGEPEVVGTPLQLAPGRRVVDVIIKLTPQALLYGKVTDEDGEAAPDAEVTVYRVSYTGGRKHLEPFTAGATQADGSVVIGHVPPGRYYLGAALHVGAQGGERDIYVPTYYPGTTDAAAATPVEVAAGAEVRGLDIKLRKSRTFRIRGHAAPNLVLELTPRDSAFAGREPYGVNTGSDGRFEFTGVLPGRYRIAAGAATAFFGIAESGAADPVPPQTVQPAAVEVTDSDLEDVVLPAGASLEISGTLTGAQPGQRPDVRLDPADGGREHPAGAPVAANGAFHIRGVLPGVYDVEVSPLPDGAYVKSVQFAGRDITTDHLDLTSGVGGTLEITVSADGGEIGGTVRNGKGDAVPGALVQVWPAGGESARTLRADEAGAFRFRGLPPADYQVIAWEALDDDLAEYAPFRARFAAQAAQVKLAERGSESLDLTAVARAASTAEAAKLR